MRIIYHSFANIGSIIVIIFIHINREYGSRFFSHITTSNEFVTDESKELTDRLLRKRTKYFFTITSTSLIVNTLLPGLSYFFTDSEFGSVNTLLYPIYSPWNMSAGNYVLTMIYQIIVFVTIFYIYGATVLFNVSAATVIYSHCKIMKRSIRSLERVNKENSGDISTNALEIKPSIKNNDENEVLERMRFIIRYHQFFTRLVLIDSNCEGDCAQLVNYRLSFCR